MQIKWISVKERLPQHLYCVIWVDIDCNVGSGAYDAKEEYWYSTGDNFKLSNITHWTSFPAPPKSL